MDFKGLIEKLKGGAEKTENRYWQIVRNETSAEGEPEADIFIYQSLGEMDGFFYESISSKSFADDLNELGDVSHIRVRINSPGGDVFTGQTIYSLLKAHKAKITVNIDGLAASAASIVAMAGDEVIMPKNAMIMIHNPWSFASGDAREMRKTAEVLDQVRETIISAYQEKTDIDRATLINMLNSETWMTAAQAKELGFADTITQEVKVQASKQLGVFNVNGINIDFGNMQIWPGALLATATDIPDDIVSAAEPEPDTKPAAEPEPDAITAANTERARLQAIDEIANGLPASMADIINDAKYVNPITAEMFAVKVMQSQEFRNNQMLEDRRNAAGAAVVSAGASTLDDDETIRSTNIKTLAEQMLKNRGEK